MRTAIASVSGFARVLALGAVMLLAALTAACDDTDPQWELDNDRIIAVRASSPQLAPGEKATLDVLVTAEGRGPFVMPPLGALVVPVDPKSPNAQPIELPAVLTNAVRIENGQWTVVAPSAAELDQARGQLGIAAGEPVTLLVGVRVDPGAGPLDAVKAVQLGVPATVGNPTLGAVTINGQPAADGLVLPKDTDVILTVEAGAEDDVYWLSSIGDLSDEEDAVAELNHDSSKSDEHLLEGHIAVVVRTKQGGVTWGFWSAKVE
jgi:hypothetical protein